MRRHVTVIFLVALLTVLYTWPVFRHPTQTIPGVPGDNILFYWDIWRSQQALAAGESPLFTRCVFYPLGHTMVFHTNSVVHAVLLYPLQGWLSLASMFNVWVFGSFVLGGWGAYLLGRYVLEDHWSALLVAFVFSFSPFRLSHLGNHMMIFSAHWLPFYVLFLLRMREGYWWHGVLTGVFLALTAWTDFHQTIHLFVFTVFTLLWWALACTRLASFGTWTDIAHLPARRHSDSRSSIERDSDSTTRTSWPFASFSVSDRFRPLMCRLILFVATTVVLTVPLLIPCMQEVMRSGADDAGRRPDGRDVLMRSARPANFILPPARHPLWGWLGQENTELQLTMGIAVSALCLVAWRGRHDKTASVPYWAAASLVIVALAMGPILMLNSKYTLRVDGTEYNLPMPHALLDRIPGINMARAPARFMALGTLTIATLAGFGMRWLVVRGYWKWALAAAAGVAIEFAGKPFPLLSIAIPPELSQLAKHDGSVLDLPFGVGSALRQSGHMDYYSILYQTAHGRPRVGGMISRCSDRYRQELLAEPVLGSLLGIYEGRSVDPAQRIHDHQRAVQTMNRYGIRHVLLRFNQQGKAAHQYLCELFPHAIEHTFENGSSWISLNIEEAEIDDPFVTSASGAAAARK
jgi:hypothetical protein